MYEPKEEEFEFETVQVDKYGQIIKRERKQARQYVEDLGNGVMLEMVSISGGTFLMGSPTNEVGRHNDESPQHQVTIAPFYMGKYPVTQAQWEAVMGNNPSYFKGANRPVECISWDNAVEFCEKLSQKIEQGYRLPSEVEWEYACRAGTVTPFYFGETITSKLANYDGNSTYASGPKGNYHQQTTDVGNFPPNAFGLYDMHGNVLEWCLNPSHLYYGGPSVDGSLLWEGYKSFSVLMLRGGSWSYYPRRVRSANRSYRSRAYRASNIGLRVVCAVRTLFRCFGNE